MNIDKESVIGVLKLINNPGTNSDIITSGCLTNIQIFGDQIDINLEMIRCHECFNMNYYHW